jgi:hypothetical protein
VISQRDFFLQIQNKTTTISKKAKECRLGYVKVVYNKVKTEGEEERKEKVLLHADNRSNTVTNQT